MNDWTEKNREEVDNEGDEEEDFQDIDATAKPTCFDSLQ